MVSRPPGVWQVSDVLDWLRSLDLSQYVGQFESLGIDGALLLQITDEDLAHDLGVTVRLHRVKLLSHIELLRSMQSAALSQSTEIDLNVLDSDGLVMYRSVHLSTPHRSDARCNFLTLKAVDGALAGHCFLVGVGGANIGRQSASSDIVLSESSISRRHCRIVYCDRTNQFLLQDMCSTTGTFLMVRRPMPLKIGALFQTGSTEFQVYNILYNHTGAMVEMVLLVFEGPSGDVSVHVSAQGLSIGRDRTNGYCAQDDVLMSAFHAKVYVEDSRFYLVDVGSSNKTWMRLSPEGERSDLYPLVQGDVIKLGASVLQVQEPNVSQAHCLYREKLSTCSGCGEREGSAQYCCGHSTCAQCAVAYDACQECRHSLSEGYH